MELADYILEHMDEHLSDKKMKLLKKVIDEGIEQINIKVSKTNEQLLEDFIKSKMYQSCSEGTIEGYKLIISLFLKEVNKDVRTVGKKDIEEYLQKYKEKRNVKSSSLNCIRINISSFFDFLMDEEIVNSNPVLKTKAIKEPVVVREIFSDTEINKLRDGCKCLRDKAMLETFITTGCRVSELCGLNRTDIEDRSTVIRGGKGGKDRKIYFSENSWYFINKYLETRKDDNPALFIGPCKFENWET